MQAIDLSKPFSVDVFNDGGPIDQSPWRRLGEFDDLSEAISTSKMIMDMFLKEHSPFSSSANHLTLKYLKQGPMPIINGAKNLESFDVYGYLDRRCYELILGQL